MEAEALQDFLAAGLLEIGDDDTRFEYLKSAAEDVAGELAEEPNKIPKHTLVGLDPDVPPDDPVIGDVEETIMDYWETLRGRYDDTPKRLIRAVIVEALQQLVKRHPDQFGSVIWLSGSGLVSYAEIRTEDRVVGPFFEDLGAALEELAIEEWGKPPSDIPRMPTPHITVEGISVPKIKKNSLKEGFVKAAGNMPNVDDSNPHWPSNNQNWVNGFAPRAADAIMENVTPVLKALSEGLNSQGEEIQEALRDHAKAVRAALKTATGHLEEVIDIEARRSRLLWWRETLYSEAGHVEYRKLSPAGACLLMVIDLGGLLPNVAPRSVEFLLREAMRDVMSSEGESSLSRISIEEFLEQAGNDFREYVGTPSELGEIDHGDGRIPFLQFARESIVKDSSRFSENISERVGVEGTTEFAIDHLGVWLLRELEADSILAERIAQ